MMNYMLNRMNCFAVVLVVAMAGACKSSKNTVAETKTESATLTEAKTVVHEDAYRVIVSFISTGAGTDSKAFALLKDYISRNDEKGVAISHETINWGREGEVDVCFKLKEMDQQDADTFVKNLRKLFEGNNLVQITENSPALHQPRPEFKSE